MIPAEWQLLGGPHRTELSPDALKGRSEFSGRNKPPRVPGGLAPWRPQMLGAWGVPPYPSLRTSEVTELCLFPSVATTGDLDPDEVLPRGHGEGAGEFPVAVSQPEGGPLSCAAPEVALPLGGLRPFLGTEPSRELLGFLPFFLPPAPLPEGAASVANSGQSTIPLAGALTPGPAPGVHRPRRRPIVRRASFLPGSAKELGK